MIHLGPSSVVVQMDTSEMEDMGGGEAAPEHTELASLSVFFSAARLEN